MFYAPNNAVVVVSGDFEPASTKAWIEKYFAAIPKSKLPAPPDLTEPRQEKEKHAGRTDPLANRPRSASAITSPTATRPNGMRSVCSTSCSRRARTRLLYDELVRKRALTGAVEAGINFGLGSMFDYNAPRCSGSRRSSTDSTTPTEQVLAACRLSRHSDTEGRQSTRRRSIGRSSRHVRRSTPTSSSSPASGARTCSPPLRYSTTIPDRINRLEAEFAKVTPALLQKTANEYLRRPIARST
jgi:hypothetical protein